MQISTIIQWKIKRSFQNADLISSQSRYDRFDTSAYLIFIAPPRTAFGKTRHPIKPVVMGFPADKVTCRMQTFECSLLRPLEYICIFNFVARNFPQGVISSAPSCDCLRTSAYSAAYCTRQIAYTVLYQLQRGLSILRGREVGKFGGRCADGSASKVRPVRLRR